MILNSPRIVLKSFSDGSIGWREACRDLNLETYAELEVLMKLHGFGLYQPDPAESARKMDELDKFLYGEDEI